MEHELERRLEPVLRRAGIEGGTANAIINGRTDLPRDRALALVMIDPVGIQNEVLASRRFVTRLGASDALRAWDEEVRSDSAWCALFAGGGQAALIATAGEAAAVAADLEGRFSKRRLGRLGVATRACSPHELSTGPEWAEGSVSEEALSRVGWRRHGGGFGALLDQVRTQLRAVKDGIGPSDWERGERPCAECGRRTADIVRNDELVCPTCDVMHRRGTNALGNEEAAQFDKLSPKLAFLVIDGTGVGAALGTKRTILEYEHFSSTLTRAFDWVSVREDLQTEAIPVVRGGDDLGMVFAASQGFAGAARVLQGLRRRLEEIGVGVGAGLVIGNTIGARPAMELGHRLMSRAKQRARHESSGAPPRYALDFEVVGAGSVLSSDLKDMRESRRISVSPVQGWDDLPTQAVRGWRPLMLDELAELVCVERRITEDLSSDWGAVHRLAERLERDPVEGGLFAAYLLRNRKGLGEALGASTVDPWTEAAGWLWRPDPESPNVRQLGLPDLLDVHRAARTGGEA